MSRQGTALDAVGALADPLRRRLYEIAEASEAGVTREAAGRAAGVARHVAAYHLDRLAARGLLLVERRRSGQRSGPGAGRPAKVYRRAATPVEVSLPPRNHALAARVLLDAVAASPSGGAALTAVARRRGEEIGRAAPGDLAGVLRDGGFEPLLEDGELRLRNCAFHELAAADRSLVCAMNLALMRGVAAGLGAPGVAVEQRPPGAVGCCVVFRTEAAATA